MSDRSMSDQRTVKIVPARDHRSGQVVVIDLVVAGRKRVNVETVGIEYVSKFLGAEDIQ